MGRGLYSYYKDGDILICTRFELRGDSLWVELASVSLKDPRISTMKENMIEIQSYRLGSVQSGELKRKKSQLLGLACETTATRRQFLQNGDRPATVRTRPVMKSSRHHSLVDATLWHLHTLPVRRCVYIAAFRA
jgi:hypothetical protein